MPYPALAVVTGLVLGFALGGRLRYLGERAFPGWFLLLLGVVLQLVVEADGVPAPFAVLLLSYAYLIAFAVVNLRHTGMAIVLIGICLNATVIAANHGMPVRPSAMLAADMIEADEQIEIDEVKHRLEEPDSKLMFLGDIVPVQPLRQVLSFGDLILCVGLVDVMVHLMRPARTRRRHEDEEAEPATEPVDARWDRVVDLVDDRVGESVHA